ncbi:MAG: hypothetical protein WD316_04405 [Phycisphaeraceae bacterium]
MTMMQAQPWIARAQEIALSQRRALSDADIEHVRFLVDLARHHRFSPATLDAKLYWYVTYNRPRVAPATPATPAPATAIDRAAQAAPGAAPARH